MKFVYLFFVFLIIQVNGGVVKKQPTFATPVYSDSYLPAAMQVIFHAVEQLKAIGKEDAELATSTTIIPTTTFPTTKLHEPGQVQPMPTIPSVVKPIISDSSTTLQNDEPIMLEQTTHSTLNKPTEKPTSADSSTTLEKEKPMLLEQTTQITFNNKPTVKPAVADSSTTLQNDTPIIFHIHHEYYSEVWKEC